MLMIVGMIVNKLNIGYFRFLFILHLSQNCEVLIVVYIDCIEHYLNGFFSACLQRRQSPTHAVPTAHGGGQNGIHVLLLRVPTTPSERGQKLELIVA